MPTPPRRPSLPVRSAGLLFAALLASTGAWGVAAAQTAPPRPLVSEDGSPLHRFSLTPVTDGADPVAPGRWSVETWSGWGNIFEQDSAATHDLFLDFERLVTTTTVRYGLAPGVEVGARLAFETTGAGILDGFVSGWHGLLNLGNANRGRFPSGVYEQRLADGAGRTRLDVAPRTFALHDTRLFLKMAVWQDPAAGRVVSAKAVWRIPGGDLRAAGSGTDAALMGLARTRWGSFHVQAMVGGTALRVPPALRGIVRDSGWFATLGAQRPLFGSVAGLAQVSWSSARLDGFHHRELDSSPTILVFGAAGTLADGWVWEVSFQEDVPADTPAVDFTVGVGLRRVF